MRQRCAASPSPPLAQHLHHPRCEAAASQRSGQSVPLGLVSMDYLRAGRPGLGPQAHLITGTAPKPLHDRTSLIRTPEDLTSTRCARGLPPREGEQRQHGASPQGLTQECVNNTQQQRPGMTPSTQPAEPTEDCAPHLCASTLTVRLVRSAVATKGPLPLGAGPPLLSGGISTCPLKRCTPTWDANDARAADLTAPVGSQMSLALIILLTKVHLTPHYLHDKSINKHKSILQCTCKNTANNIQFKLFVKPTPLLSSTKRNPKSHFEKRDES